MSFDNLSTKYVGQGARDYDRVRAGRKWDAEHEAISQLLTYIDEGSTVLDIPVGTGRLFPFFEARRFEICGIDVSSDMLEQAQETAESVGGRIRLEKGDIWSVAHPNCSFDLVVSLRFLNMVDAHDLRLILAELSRLSRDKLLIGMRYVTPFAELIANADAPRLAVRPIRLARRVRRRLFGRTHNLVVFQKRFLDQLLDELGLEILETRYVERRWDSTDYVLWLLQKREPNAAHLPRSAASATGRSAR